jgi:hypothetical protein
VRRSNAEELELRLPNGIYAIEGTQTSYWPNHCGSSEDLNRADTTRGFVKRLVDGLNHQELRIPGYEPRAVHCDHNPVFIQKGLNSERTNIPPRAR